MNDLIITQQDGSPVRIGDVGRAVAGVENDRQVARFKQSMAVGLGVVKQRDANTVALADSVRRRMADLVEDFPPGLRYTIATDDSRYIEQSVNDLVTTIFLTTGLVALVVLGFLRSPLGTIIAVFAIPTSLLGGLALIYSFGFTLNVLTLLGLILAIGIVIDDAVVVLESSYRHLESGKDRREAARIGTSEVAFPNIANTLALASVFVPVAFTAGLISRFFYEFSLTVAMTVFASTFTALTLTPMLCSRFLRTANTKSRWYRATQKVLDANQTIYNRTIAAAFRHRILALSLALAAGGLMVFFYGRLATEFQPPIDRSEFMVRFETPEGSTLEFADAYARKLETALADLPEVDHFFMAIGLSRGAGPGKVNEGLIFVHLVERGQRDRRQIEVMQAFRERAARIPDGNAYVMSQGSSIGGRGAELQVVLQNPSLQKLASRQDQIMAWMRQEPEYLGVNSNLKMNKPQIEVEILRDKASQMNISVTQISNTMRFLLGEPQISEIEQENERYEVIPEIVSKGEMVPDALSSLYVRADSGDLVPLANVVSYRETIGPSEIHRFNRLRSATLSASNPPGVALGTALNKLQAYFDRTLPSGFDHAVTGRAKDFRESFYYLSIALGFSVVFVYLVLAAQFESFLQPFVILATLPLAGVGAFAALWALDMTLNIFSFIGMIMLVGMATKNAILMIDYANQIRAKGKLDLIEATQEAARIRFRPVIMTTISTVLGIMPIALGFGAGGEARAPLGVVVASGLLVTTLLTLVVIPVLYSLTEAAKQRLAQRLSRHTDSKTPTTAE
jgi:hydrophobe/amphiphile efflux-1 (HAE1) family protein